MTLQYTNDVAGVDLELQVLECGNMKVGRAE